jgi:hypothetical protein
MNRNTTPLLPSKDPRLAVRWMTTWVIVVSFRQHEGEGGWSKELEFWD